MNMNKIKFSRRNFLKMAGAASVGLSLTACGVKPTDMPIPTETLVPKATMIFTPPPILPMPTAVLTNTPSPTVEVKMLDLPQTKTAADEFAAAIPATEIQAGAEQIQEGLSIKEITGKDGKKYETALTQNGYPLMIRSEGGVWSGDTLKTISDNILGVAIGTAVETSEPYTSAVYQNTVIANFDAIFPGGDFFQNTIDRWGNGKANFFVDFASTDDLTLFIHPGFYRYDQTYLENVDLPERLDLLKKRARTILSFVKKVDGVSQKQPAYVTMFNEPFGRYLDGAGIDTPGWKVESIAQQTMGKDTLIDTYIMFHEAAQTQGLEIGRDVFFQFSEYGINTNNPKYRMALTEFKRAKTEIAKRLNITVDKVQFGLALEQRYDENNPLDMPNSNTGRVRAPTEQELETTTSEFSKTVDFINFTECSDNPATAEQRQMRFKTLLKVAQKLGVREIVFENPLRFTEEEPDMTYKGTDLFTPEYKKSMGYFTLVKDAFDLAIQT